MSPASALRIGRRTEIIDGGDYRWRSKRVQRSEYRCNPRQNSWLGQRQLAQAQAWWVQAADQPSLGAPRLSADLTRRNLSAQSRVLALMEDTIVVQLMERGHARDARRELGPIPKPLQGDATESCHGRRGEFMAKGLRPG